MSSTCCTKPPGSGGTGASSRGRLSSKDTDSCRQTAWQTRNSKIKCATVQVLLRLRPGIVRALSVFGLTAIKMCTVHLRRSRLKTIALPASPFLLKRVRAATPRPVKHERCQSHMHENWVSGLALARRLHRLAVNALAVNTCILLFPFLQERLQHPHRLAPTGGKHSFDFSRVITTPRFTARLSWLLRCVVATE